MSGVTPTEGQPSQHEQPLQQLGTPPSDAHRLALPEHLYGSGREGVQFNPDTNLSNDWHQELGRMVTRLAALCNDPAFRNDPELRAKWIERLAGNATGCQTYTEVVSFRLYRYILQQTPPPHPTIDEVLNANKDACAALDELATRIKGWGNELRQGREVKIRPLLLLMEIGYEILKWEKPEIFNAIQEEPLQQMLDEYRARIRPG